MIQDIFPNRLDNQYVECSPQDNDVIFFFEGSSLLAKYIKEDTLTYPLYKQFIQGIKTPYLIIYKAFIKLLTSRKSSEFRMNSMRYTRLMMLPDCKDSAGR